jgi:hypothetical protein
MLRIQRTANGEVAFPLSGSRENDEGVSGSSEQQMRQTTWSFVSGD